MSMGSCEKMAFMLVLRSLCMDLPNSNGKSLRDRSQIMRGAWKISLCAPKYFRGLLQNHEINFDGYSVIRRNFSKFFCWFSALQRFDLIDTTYWCKLLKVKGPQDPGPEIKAAVSLLKWFGIIVFVYRNTPTWRRTVFRVNFWNQ